MGIFLKIFALIMGMIMAFFSSGTPKQSYEPETVDINGVTYKNCFIPEYARIYNMKDETGHDIVSFSGKEPFYVGKNGQKWYSLEDGIILKGSNIYSDTYSEGTLYYCPETEWNARKTYYYDMNNWKCSMSKTIVVGQNEDGTYDISNTEIHFDSVDSEQWNEMMHFNRCYNNYDVKTVVIDYNDRIKLRADFSMISKDGLFVSYSHDVYNVDGEYYVQLVSMGPQMQAVKVPDSMSPYLNELTSM